jgi:hypothetical protein
MQIHTYNVQRKYLVSNIRATYPQYSEAQFSYVKTDRLEYLENLVTECEPNAESEIKRILNLK